MDPQFGRVGRGHGLTGRIEAEVLIVDALEVELERTAVNGAVAGGFSAPDFPNAQPRIYPRRRRWHPRWVLKEQKEPRSVGRTGGIR